MEDLDGYQVLAEMRQDHRYAHTPFIFLSALADRKDVIVGKVHGGDGYLTKPVDFEILLVTVASHLRQMARVNRNIDRIEKRGISTMTRLRTILGCFLFALVTAQLAQPAAGRPSR